MLSHDEDPIIALCTPRGKGALALIRLSGTGVRKLADSCAQLASGKQIREVPSHTIHYGWMLDSVGSHLDQVMFIVMDAPRTFTGQDTIEITCHNNPFLIDMIIERFIKQGARLAQEGEFSRRAFAQGKVDLLQAEAINELISAHTQQALKKSLAQLEGSFSHWVTELERELVKTLAWCEASFEFLDDESEFAPEITHNIEDILKKIGVLKKTFAAQVQIREGVKIALIGSVNAGKSSLFNALLDKKRALVHERAGTTRDVIEAGFTHNQTYWTLIDTAGLRQTEDSIEQEGIKKSLEEAHKADCILLIVDGSRSLTDQEKVIYEDILSQYPSKCILICNKADLSQVSHSFSVSSLSVSTVTQQNIETVRTAIAQKIEQLYARFESPFLLNQRHHGLLIQLEQKLLQILPLLKDTVHYELVSYHLQDALTLITELTGKSISEAGLDMVFKEFCVGK